VVKNHTTATHVVADDPDLDGGGAEGDNDDGEDEPEKEYVRTVTVADDPLKGRMTLAHWWYFPPSYDEWMDSKEVTGDLEAEPRMVGPSSEGRWIVSCRFIRDVARFNEWGNESDYAIVD